jgi:hypothetical protein
MFSDRPKIDREVMLLMVGGLGKNPYRPADMEEPEPMTASDVVEDIRRRYGDRAAGSVRITMH